MRLIHSALIWGGRLTVILTGAEAAGFVGMDQHFLAAAQVANQQVAAVYPQDAGAHNHRLPALHLLGALIANRFHKGTSYHIGCTPSYAQGPSKVPETLPEPLLGIRGHLLPEGLIGGKQSLRLLRQRRSAAVAAPDGGG